MRKEIQKRRKTSRGINMDASETIASIIIFSLLFSIGFATCYALTSVFHQTIAGEGFLTYTGMVEIKSIDIISSSQLEASFNILEANNYTIQVSINQHIYQKQATWNIGIESLIFNVTFPESPFEIAIKVLET